MPRIDPLQLLKTLSVLLSPEGGILSQEEVPRLVNLMTKFSKKLVSKCVYVLILQNTEQSLVNAFMADGGWNLIFTWLQDACNINNFDLIKEILSLLLVTPVNTDRLRSNSLPKLVKSLTKPDNVLGVQELAKQLVQDWLVIVKSGTAIRAEVQEQVVPIDTVDSSQIKGDESEIIDQPIPTKQFYKVVLRDGKQVISRNPIVLSTGANTPASNTPVLKATVVSVKPSSPEPVEAKPTNEEESDKKSSSSSSSDRSKSRSSSKSSSTRSKSSSSKDRHKSSSSRGTSSSRRDKDKDRRDKDKDRDKSKHRENGSKSSGKETKVESKEKQAEKDKDTLAKIKPQSINKLGRIPKKNDEKSAEPKEVKKPTMSIEVRKNTEDRPKTVKIFNSKRRSTGLEEEAKPPPSRTQVIKKPTAVLPASLPLKRPSPIRELIPPPEKKSKVEIAERPGAIKLIPPKPKPAMLQESDIFMDALAASATTKKEPKKRKRRPSNSKDRPDSPTPAEPSTPTSPTASPIGLKNIAAPNFYQDTLETTGEEQNAEDNNDDKDNKEEDQQQQQRPGTPMETTEMEDEVVDAPKEINSGDLKGVLLYTKRKGPKKSVKFNDNNLTQVRYFELDETERVNVTKTFMDMAKMEMTSEREAIQTARKVPNEDTMEPQVQWRLPFVIDQNAPLAVPGFKSLEKDIQFAREKTILQALYFDKRKIPDSPEEPIPENHQMNDPILIPLEDADSQEIDLRGTPWPEPKGAPPDNLDPPPQIFNNSMQMPFQSFHGVPPPFQPMPPRFIPPGPQGGVFAPPSMMPNGMPPQMVPHPDMLNRPLNPNAFVMDNNNFPNPAMMGGEHNFGMPFQQPPNMGMFPPNNFNNNNNNNMNRGGRGGGFRRGGGGNNNGPWIRMNGPGNWNNNNNNNRGGGPGLGGGGGGGGGGRGGGGRLCKNVKNHGYCWNIEKCQFFHPKQ